MKISARELGALLNGTVEGDPDVFVHQLSKIEEGAEGSLSFIANPKYAPYAYTTQASILIVNEDFELHQSIKPTLIRVKDAYGSFALLLEKVGAVKKECIGIHQQAFAEEGAEIGEEVSLGAFSYIAKGAKIGKNTWISTHCSIGANVKIGENTIIYAGVKIYDNCVIGSNCIIHAGTVIGSDGFGFAPQADGSFKKIPQSGNVLIEDDVEIGANVSIDCATMGSTIIRQGVKLDNLIQIAHNVEIGKNTVIAAQTGVSGSTKLGHNCMIGGQVGFVGHLSIAPGTKINAQSGISKSIKEPNLAFDGSPAFGYRDNLRSQAYFRKLPEIAKRLRELEVRMRNDE